MFKNLFKFETQRSGKEAFGFYLAYFAMITLIIMIIGPLLLPQGLNDAQLLEQVQQFQETQTLPEDLEGYIRTISFYSALFALTVTTGLALAVTMKKNIFRKPKILAVIIFTIFLAYLMGPMISLIGIAWLTTRPDESAGAPQES